MYILNITAPGTRQIHITIHDRMLNYYENGSVLDNVTGDVRTKERTSMTVTVLISRPVLRVRSSQILKNRSFDRWSQSTI